MFGLGEQGAKAFQLDAPQKISFWIRLTANFGYEVLGQGGLDDTYLTPRQPASLLLVRLPQLPPDIQKGNF